MTEIVGTEKLTNERWLNLFCRTFRRGGETFRWLFASRKPDAAMDRKVDAVLIVPILIDGLEDGVEPKLVATREWRATICDYEWGVPAGLCDGDENPIDTARRELMEETGYELVEVQKISPPNYSSTGMTDELVVMVYCTCRTPPNHRQHLDGAELIEVHPLSLAQVDQLVDTKEPINGRAWGAFYLYHRLRRFV